MTMNKISLVFACLACAGHAHKGKASTEELEGVDSKKALASMLLANDPTAAFAGAIAGQHAQAIKASRSVDASMAVKDAANALPFLEAPASQSSGLVGAEAGFDPLYLSDFFDIRRMREAELKHGRICMLAATGIIFQEFYSIPGYPGYTPNPVEACKTVPPEAFPQILALMAFLEIRANPNFLSATRGDVEYTRAPGDVGFDPLKFGENPDSEAYKKLQLAELKNGRLAMLAFAGMLHQVFVTGKPVIASLGDIFATP